MKKTVKVVFAFALAFGVALLWSNAFAQETFGAWELGPGGTCFENFTSKGWDVFEAGWLIGQKVSSPVGGNLGQISDLLIDRSDGHIAMAILSDVPGFGAGFVVAPMNALERISENTLQLNFGDQDIPIAPSPEDQYATELTKSRDIVGLSAIPSAIDPLFGNRVYEFYGQKAYWADRETPQESVSVYRVSHPSIGESLLGKTSPPALMGATVRSEDQKSTARVDDLIIDSKGGRVALLVIDKVPGRGDTEEAIPFGEVSIDGNAFVLNTTQDKLAAAPSFNEDTDLHNSTWAENVYKFFGQQPCWN